MKKILIIFVLALFVNVANAVEIQDLQSEFKGLYIQQKEIPTVNILLTFKAGSIYEGKYFDGTANLVANLLNKGTDKLTAKQISQKLEKLASGISFASGRDTFAIEVKSLEENIEPTLQVLQDILSNPNFPEKEIKIAKDSILQDIKQQNENPGYIAISRAKKSFYGRKNKKAYVSVLGTKKSVEKITKKQMQDFTKKLLVANNMSVSVVGSVDNDKISKMLDKHLAVLPKGQEQGKINFYTDYMPVNIKVEKKLPQTVVLLYKKGLERNNADYYNSVVFNYLLGGGGFASRLMEEIREKRGLTYGVKSAFNYDLEIRSLFTIKLQTANKNAYLTEKLIKQELHKAVKQGFSEEELEKAKSFLIGSFPVKLRTSSKLLGYLNVIQQFGFDKDYVNNWTKNIQNVTLEDLNSFTKRFLTEQEFSRVFVGGVK